MSEFEITAPCGAERHADTRGGAQEAKDTHDSLCQDDDCEASIGPVSGASKAKADGGSVEVVDPGTGEDGNPSKTSATHPDEFNLPENGPSVDEDPLVWMPNEFTDEIDGTVAINRKGYEVMAHHYGIETRSEPVVTPDETGCTFAQAKAVAITDDGKRYEAQGSAHVDRGDDPWLLVSMADTRARKRALAQATGVGMVAVEELRAGMQGGQA